MRDVGVVSSALPLAAAVLLHAAALCCSSALLASASRASAQPPRNTDDGSTGTERVVVAPIQGTEGVRQANGPRVEDAVTEALFVHGYTVADAPRAEGAIPRCASPECVASELVRADAVFAIVPAMWARGSRRELTLTLVGKSGRNLNAGTVLNGDLSSTVASLVDQLLAKRRSRAGYADAQASRLAVAEPIPPSTSHTTARRPSDTSGRDRPNAWKAGPIALLVGGAVTIISVGAVAATRDDTEQLNKGASAAWWVVGGLSIAGGTAWWIVGNRRRTHSSDASAHRETSVRVRPRGFDLRVRF
ncbi:MAG: hypothetical protein AAF436_12315 [Myxococcota bacterium]